MWSMCEGGEMLFTRSAARESSGGAAAGLRLSDYRGQPPSFARRRAPLDLATRQVICSIRARAGFFLKSYRSTSKAAITPSLGRPAEPLWVLIGVSPQN